MGKRSLFSDYKPVTGVSLQQRVVLFLVYAKNKHPNVFVSYPELVQRINGYPKSPGFKSKEVIAVRSATSRVRKILLQDYGLGVVTDPILGVRATSDDFDMLGTQMVKAASRLRTAQGVFTLTADHVDTRKIPNTPETKPLKDWFNNSVSKVVKSITATDFATRLLPPKKDTDKA